MCRICCREVQCRNLVKSDLKVSRFVMKRDKMLCNICRRSSLKCSLSLWWNLIYIYPLPLWGEFTFLWRALSVCLYAERIFTTVWRNFAKKNSTNLFFIRVHFTCVSALMIVPIRALRVPNFCHTFDPHTSCENLMCQKWKFGAPYSCVFPCTLSATPLLNFIGTMPKL
jgi:hypothetical protein